MVYEMSNVENPVDIPLYWLVNGDSYNGLLQSPYNWVVFHPFNTANNQAERVTSQVPVQTKHPNTETVTGKDWKKPCLHTHLKY